MITVSYKSDVFGSGVFWQGKDEDVNQIRNIPARKMAQELISAKLVDTITNGMWMVERSNANGR